MNKMWDELEELTVPIRFDTKAAERKGSPRPETLISGFFKNKLERLDLEELQGPPKSNKRKPSEILRDDYLIEDHFYPNELRKQPSHIQLTKEDSKKCVDDLDVGICGSSRTGNNRNQNEKAEDTTQMDLEGFNFNLARFKRVKDSKFVIKANKSKEQRGLNDLELASPELISLSQFDPTNVQLKLEGQSAFEAKDTSSGYMSEHQRLKLKINKIRKYWNKESILIPNVYKYARLLKGSSQSLVEHQDYSMKNVLATAYNKKEDTSCCYDKNAVDCGSVNLNEAASFTRRQSFCKILGTVDDGLFLDK